MEAETTKSSHGWNWAHLSVSLTGPDDARLDVHDVVVVPCQDGDTCPRLPIPNPNGLIIRRRDDPRVLSVEEHCSDIVEIYMSALPHSWVQI
jgi:hypothetical protein